MFGQDFASSAYTDVVETLLWGPLSPSAVQGSGIWDWELLEEGCHGSAVITKRCPSTYLGAYFAREDYIYVESIVCVQNEPFTTPVHNAFCQSYSV